jgi:hypothetical protein
MRTELHVSVNDEYLSVLMHSDAHTHKVCVGG